MENEKQILPISILVSAVIVAAAFLYTIDAPNRAQIYELEKEKLLLSESAVLPVVWDNLGAQLVSTGVIDGQKFDSLYINQQLTKSERELLYGANNENLEITADNAGFLLNLLWALGLSSKNEILETGPMTDPRYGGVGNFASTGGWTMAVGNSMNHYSRHKFFELTSEQQFLVEKVSKGIYRPCCGNSAYFPDCNHGMAILGLLELMASQGVEESEMRSVAHTVNTYWFPELKNENKSRSGGCSV